MKDLIRAAREVLLQKGWTKYRCVSTDGSVCLGQAICQVADETKQDYGPLMGRIISDPMLKERVGQRESPMFRVVSFNDHPLTTKEDILSLLDRVETSCDQQEDEQR